VQFSLCPGNDGEDCGIRHITWPSPGDELAIGYASHYSRSHDAVIRVYDAAGNVIETHEHAGEFKEW
jgi:hypothetical protein